MKNYKTHKKARRAAIIAAAIPFLFGSLLTIAGVIQLFDNKLEGALLPLIMGSGLLYLVYFLINKNFVEVTLENGKLRIKPKFAKEKVFQINRLKEVVIINLPSSRERNRISFGGSTAQRMGRSIGLGMLNYAESGGKYTTSNQQMMIKDYDDSITSLNSNYINGSTNMIKEILQISKLEPIFIDSTEYFAWKRGKLEGFRKNKNVKTIKFLEKIEPFFKLKYLVYLPIIVFLSLIVILNVWFNIIHYDFAKLGVEKLENPKFIFNIKPNKKEKYKDYMADIFLKDSNILLLKDIRFAENRPKYKKSEYDYKYSLFPFENPFFFPRIVNLDSDSEPEIIYKLDDNYNGRYGVYDFDDSQNIFITKSIKLFSKDIDSYILETRGFHRNRWSYYIGELFPIVLGIYFVFLLILYGIVTGMKNKVKDN